MRMKKKLSAILTNVIAWAISAVCMIPLLLILFNSLKNSNAASDMNLKLPGSIEWSNFLNVIEKGKLGASFANSILYSVCSVAVCVLLAAMAAYVLSRNGSKFYRVIYMYLVLGITMPINYVALTKVMMFLHINNTRLGIILLYAAMQLPFSVFLIHGFVARIPRELDEAAVIDGCSAWQRIRYITLPLCKNSFKVYSILCITGCIKQFDMIWAMTGGGPNAASSTPGILLYLNAYSFKLMGRSAAIAMILLILGVVLSICCNKIFKQEEY